MSEQSTPSHLGILLSGRWQVPVAVAAVITAGVVVHRVLPRHVPFELGAYLAEVAGLEEAGATAEAIVALNNLLATHPELSPAEQAEIHERLAELLCVGLERQASPNAEVARQALEHHDTAQRLGTPPSASRALRAVQLAERLNNPARMLLELRSALELDPRPEQRRLALRGLVRHLAGRAEAEPERQRLLEELLSDQGAPMDYLWWGLQEALQTALDAGDTIRARRLLEQFGPRLRTSDLKGYEEFLRAWVTFSEGRSEEAGPIVQWVDDWLGGPRPLDEKLLRVGNLPALNRWLLGRIHLAHRAPQAALAAFTEAVQLQPFGELAIAAAAGRTTALAQLGESAAAQVALWNAIENLEIHPPSSAPRVERLRRKLFDAFAELVQRGAYSAGAELLIGDPHQLTRERVRVLTELEQGYREAADSAADESVRRAGHARAGRCLEQAADWPGGGGARQAALLWSAAQRYQQAQAARDARRVLLRFLQGRSADQRLPLALLWLGQTYESEGEYAAALHHYQELCRKFPAITETYRATLLAAGCLSALDRSSEAEAALLGLLHRDDLTPDAAVYRDALLQLSDTLYARGRFAEAIGRLENFVTLYPDDPECLRARFLLADAYQRSATALRLDPPADADPRRVEATWRQRYRQAAELFEALCQQMGGEQADDEERRLYERLAAFAHADCLLALNEPDALAAALRAYEQVAMRYEREPATLTAHVQMANIYLRQGLPGEAARVLEKARWRLAALPDGAFADAADAADRTAWQRYLAAVLSAPPLQETHAARR